MNTSKKITAALAVTVGLGALTFGLTQSQPASAQVPAVFRAHPNSNLGRIDQRGERHPELRRALRTLERTETDLRRANHDFGGHREKAADLCHQAELEIQQALRYDKK